VNTPHRSSPASHSATPNRSDSPATSALDPRRTLDTLVATDPAVCERDEVAALVASVARLRGWLDAYDVRCARRTGELAEAGHSEPAAALFARTGNLSSKDATRVADRNSVCDQLDAFEEALGDGRISSGHLDAAAAAMRNLDDDTRRDFTAAAPDLLDAAVGNSVDTFSRQCRDLARHLAATRAGSDADADELDRQRANVTVKRWVDKVTGMCHTHLELDVLRDAAVWSSINAHISRLRNADGNARTPWNQLQADAVVAAIRGGGTGRHRAKAPPHAGAGVAVVDGDGNGNAADHHATDHPSGDDAGEHTDRRAGDRPHGGQAGERTDGETDDAHHFARIPEILLLVDLRTLVDGLHEHGICETEDGIALPVSTVRRLCCDAEIVPTVLGTDGVPLEMGRSVRTANRAQRRALRSMHRTCAHPDCTVPFSQCKAHHIRWWWKHNGPTDIENLIPLCEKHHHLVHEGRWTVTMTPDRIATWTRPDGTIHHHGTCIDRHPPPRGVPRTRSTPPPPHDHPPP
jgi:hypothetical protein